MKQSRTSKVMALSLGQGLTTVVTLATAMVMARVLTEVELATYRQTLLAYQIALPLLSLGLSYAIYYFMPTETRRVRGIVIDGLIMMFVMGLLYAVFIALGGNHVLAKRFSNPAIVNTLVYLVPLPLVALPATLLASVMVVREQVNKLTVYNVLTNLILGLGIVGACLYWRTPESMVLVKVGLGVAIGLIGIRMMLKAAPRDDWHPSWDNMRNMVKFSIPLVTAGALGTISLQLDKIIVSAMCSPEEFAVYSNGAIEIPLIGIITGSIAAVIQPDLRKFAAAGDYQAALALFRQAAEKSAVILIPTMVFLMVSAEPFILTLFSDKYAGSILPFRLYLLILPIRIAQYGAFQSALGLNRAILFRSAVGLAANAASSVLFVALWGYAGAVIGTILTLYLVNCTLNMALLANTLNCRWKDVLPFSVLAKLFFFSSLAVIPLLFLRVLFPNLHYVAFLLLSAGIYTFSFLLVAFAIKTNPAQIYLLDAVTRIRCSRLRRHHEQDA